MEASTTRSFMKLAVVAALALLLSSTAPNPVDLNAQASVHTLTMNDNGTTITVPVGDSVALSLGTNVNWSVSTSNPNVLTPAPGPASDQGYWLATLAGQSTVTANGTAICSPGQACPQFAIYYQATIDVVGSGSVSPSASVQVQPGWNLVGGPAGTMFPTALYTWNAISGQYQTVSPGTPVQSGQGYWAFFSNQTSVTLNGGSSSSITLSLAAGQWQQTADPSGTENATVSGADLVFSYNPTTASYNQSTTLLPGQGAWVLSFAGATVQVVPALQAPSSCGATTNVTSSQNSQTLAMHVGDCIVLELSGPYSTWSVQVANPAILSQVQPASGSFQGAYQAISTGQTTLTATSNPPCYPLCLVPSLLFRLTVVVQ